MSGITKIVKPLEEFCLLVKGASEAIKNKTKQKEQKGGFPFCASF